MISFFFYKCVRFDPQDGGKQEIQTYNFHFMRFGSQLIALSQSSIDVNTNFIIIIILNKYIWNLRNLSLMK